MAAPTVSVVSGNSRNKSLNEKKQSKKPVRNVLCSPYISKWPALKDAAKMEIVNKLKKTFTQINLKREKRRHDGSPEDAKTKNLRGQVIMGINAVTRALERDEVHLVLVDRATQPAMLTQHILLTAATRSCPAAQVEELARTMAPLLGVTSLSALAFRKRKENDENDLDTVVEYLVSRTPTPKIPWLEQTSVASDTETSATTNVSMEETKKVLESEEKQIEQPCSSDSAAPAPAPAPAPAAVKGNSSSDLDRFYVLRSESTLVNGKVPQPDFGSADYVAFDDSSSELAAEFQEEPKLTVVTHKHKQPPKRRFYETAHIGKIVKNEDRPSIKRKRVKK